MAELEIRHIVAAQKQEIARLVDDRVLLLAQLAQTEEQVATLATELSKLKGGADADPEEPGQVGDQEQ